MGLKALKQQMAQEDKAREERSSGGGFVKALRDYELLKKHDNAVRLRFAQEMDEDAANVTDKGLGVIFTEHATPFNKANPKGFRTARCTMESEGNCYGCERYADRSDENSKGWRPFQRIYVNAIAETTDDDGNKAYLPFVWAQKARSSVVAQLMEYAEDADTITDAVFKFSKSGKDTDTKYNLMPTRQDVAPYDASGVELYDLEKVSPAIPYEKQAAFYGGGVVATEESSNKPAVAKPTESDDETW